MDMEAPMDVSDAAPAPAAEPAAETADPEEQKIIEETAAAAIAAAQKLATQDMAADIWIETAKAAKQQAEVEAEVIAEWKAAGQVRPEMDENEEDTAASSAAAGETKKKKKPIGGKSKAAKARPSTPKKAGSPSTPQKAGSPDAKPKASATGKASSNKKAA